MNLILKWLYVENEKNFSEFQDKFLESYIIIRVFWDCLEKKFGII